MSGVIMDGVQYEHCCQCGKFVKFSELVYAKVRSDLTPRWPQYEMQDLCSNCAEIEADPEAELQLDDDRWAEAHKRASAFTSVTADDYPVISRGIYEQLCKEGWHP